MKKIFSLLIAFTLFQQCSIPLNPILTEEDVLIDGWYFFDEYRYMGRLVDGYAEGEGIKVYRLETEDGDDDGVKIEGHFKRGLLLSILKSTSPS